MAKFAAEQEHPALKVLRENIEALQGDLSYRTLAKEAGVPETVGRSINGLVKGDRRSRIDTVFAAAAGLNVEVWQLFVPCVAELTPFERKKLQQLVDAYIAGGEGMRQVLNGTVSLNTPAVEMTAIRQKR